MSKLYLHATLKLRMGGYKRFCEVFAPQVPILESYGWKLVGAWVTVVGRVHTVVDVWEIADGNAFYEATAKWRARPDFAEFQQGFAEVVEEEVLTMVNKTSYSP